MNMLDIDQLASDRLKALNVEIVARQQRGELVDVDQLHGRFAAQIRQLSDAVDQDRVCQPNVSN